jgi:hypothetical protein
VAKLGCPILEAPSGIKTMLGYVIDSGRENVVKSAPSAAIQRKPPMPFKSGDLVKCVKIAKPNDYDTPRLVLGRIYEVDYVDDRKSLDELTTGKHGPQLLWLKEGGHECFWRSYNFIKVPIWRRVLSIISRS